jgi:hypothetical protein
MPIERHFIEGFFIFHRIYVGYQKIKMAFDEKSFDEMAFDEQSFDEVAFGFNEMVFDQVVDSIKMALDTVVGRRYSFFFFILTFVSALIRNLTQRHLNFIFIQNVTLNHTDLKWNLIKIQQTKSSNRELDFSALNIIPKKIEIIAKL